MRTANRAGAMQVLAAATLLGSIAPSGWAAGQCKPGYVWREAFPGDYICTTPERRAAAQADNRAAAMRRQPGGGPYGQATCRQGYVWREAASGDVVCVTPQTRDEVAQDNRHGRLRVVSGAPPPARGGGRTCTVYEHRDFGGAHRTLGHRDVLRMVDAPALGTSDGVYRYLYEPAWNDRISSFRTGPGCTMTLWEHVNQGGHYLRANRDRAYVGDGWNDMASDAVCECADSATY